MPKDDSFTALENRVRRRRKIPTAVETFERLHTGPHSELLMSQFRQKRIDLDWLAHKNRK